MCSDLPGLQKRLKGLRKRLQAGKPIDRGLPALKKAIQDSVDRRAQRHSLLPNPQYPEQLPVSQKREAILELLQKNQVLILCGETGSGKTTQLPKLCLELGRGTAGLIGHTQPRRIAARSVATRIAEELNTPLGAVVGYKVRFSDHSHPRGYIKLMTDGILLAEIQSDPELRQYDTLIIDEAHERSLNIDFLLGYLKELLPRRPDLKLIITSATIDPERFSKHFQDAPILTVSGRSYPVEIRYRPLVSEDEEGQDRDRQEALLEAVDELAGEGSGDILIFLPGEREIRETAESLRKHHPPHTEILPLYARLSASDQQRVFAPHSGRRIVLSTNVAETSLTVPGIRYVIDTGIARISRYSWRSKVQRLHIEPISQASANQRSGRCGRVSEGICIRLYSEQDYEARPLFTDPEILRTNLALVILQMAHLGLGRMDAFPFVETPDQRLIKDGYKLLFELGAVDRHHKITKRGRQLARLPLDPRLGRMLLEAENLGALAETLVIVSSLAIQDPRERPQDLRQAADEAHSEFQDPKSDFLTRLNIWSSFQEQSQHLSHNKLRRYCKDRFLSYLRMREWISLHQQLRGQLLEMGYHEKGAPADYDAIHQALISGLLDHIGFKDEKGEYLGARNRRFRIFPTSGLSKQGPKWIMAAQLLDTGKLYALDVASIQPEWIERYASHLIKRSYSEPHWQERRAQVGAFEHISLYGLVIHPRRRVNYGPIDPETSRSLFIRHALILGEYQSQAGCLEKNRALVNEIEDLEARARRRDILVDEDSLYRFYDDRLPGDIYNGPAFERWYREKTKEGSTDILSLDREKLTQRDTAEISSDRFPDELNIGHISLPLSYHFEPGDVRDGVTLHVPLALLKQLNPAKCEWLVPGLVEEKLTALIRALPKALRKNYVPAPDFARACFESITPADGPLLEAFGLCLKRMTGVEIPAESWNSNALEPHLQMRIEIMDEEGNSLDSGRDLFALQQAWSQSAKDLIQEAPPEKIERDDITDWDFDTLPETVEIERQGYTLKAWPALVDGKNTVAIRLFDDMAQAQRAHRDGLRRLYLLHFSSEAKEIQRKLPEEQRLCLLFASLGRCQELKQDILDAVFDRAFILDKAYPVTRKEFLAICDEGRPSMRSSTEELCKLLLDILEQHHKIRQATKGNLPLNWIEAAADIRVQLDGLVYKGFLLRTPNAELRQYPRYLKAIERRLERLDQQPDADRMKRIEIQPLQERYQKLIEQRPELSYHEQVQDFRWQLEELRVSLFAQGLGTRGPVSANRLEKKWKELTSLLSH